MGYFVSHRLTSGGVYIERIRNNKSYPISVEEMPWLIFFLIKMQVIIRNIPQIVITCFCLRYYQIRIYSQVAFVILRHLLALLFSLVNFHNAIAVVHVLKLLCTGTYFVSHWSIYFYVVWCLCKVCMLWKYLEKCRACVCAIKHSKRKIARFAIENWPLKMPLKGVCLALKLPIFNLLG